MKRILLLAALASALSAGCTSKPLQAEDHWNARSVPPRVTRVMTGYNTDEDGEVADYAWKQKQHVQLMAQRHFLNWNPENPFQQEDPSLYRTRPFKKRQVPPATYPVAARADRSAEGTTPAIASTAYGPHEYSDLNPNVPIGRR